eukprot:CAMPEP_0182853760 /NCGR_PEP_ID=MMETSP0034_2-20130328/873_1 /TAXON_ID=156128 /ORGANISM="Nephroselmis pyriformis, Strain CCMP717" /LENGTH=106 /DNA_ID=CAMNT_0024984541 /DNA_START=348 /DNA_END=668 /DNA_ORIENTATION=+
MEIARVHRPRLLVDAAHVHARGELDLRGLVGVALVAVQLQAVDAAIVHSVGGADDSASPTAHEHIVAVLHAIADGSVADALLALLQLLQQAEVARNDDWATAVHRH